MRTTKVSSVGEGVNPIDDGGGVQHWYAYPSGLLCDGNEKPSTHNMGFVCASPGMVMTIRAIAFSQ